MEEDLIKQRLKKLEELKKLKVNPYPYSFNKRDNSSDLVAEFKSLKNDERTKRKASIAGRVVALREMGKASFGHIQDGKGKIQFYIREDEVGEKAYRIFKLTDLGDIIGINGYIFKTKTGEVTVRAENYELLTKGLRPLPEKWHGLKDIEIRYRKRYLDLIMNPEVKKVFETREKIIDAIREFLKSKGFNEVDIPVLQTVYGGASAAPFKTHLNALDIDLFLAISPELYLKRLIVGGYDKVFTISRNFRNEGIDKWHNPEFTMMEIYQSYADYNDMMNLFEEIYEYTARKVNGKTKIEFAGRAIDFKKPWKRMTMAAAIKKYANIDITKMSNKEISNFVKRNKIESKEDVWGWNTQAIFEHFCEDKIEQPTFILDHPLETTPLCKTHREDKLCRIIERFEPFCMGTELGNAYSELNDPELQRELLEKQQKMLKKGDEEANPLDEDFLEAIEIGMPPTGGLGLGIDRMVMLLTGQESIKDVILFPFMRPLDKEEKESDKNEGMDNRK